MKSSKDKEKDIDEIVKIISSTILKEINNPSKKRISKENSYSRAVKVNSDSPVWKNKPRCN